ncbi:F0F1 ATP synthase subunit gamma [Sulfitobacter guttiformis]|uniref:F-type H+-transporting ATPase subunit gamma n=1 Tax=Sulfitobacter guttiformis TaxID=74349 RepID=A0A420DJ87_9RHOB|nr:FoF1 ATP synthase subunit gamma [Sulfitobacter guttiformis]KIN71910.1 ATP synthase gamma chain [Sulfitobacter guttiformis KCTC 32187]RKE94281.1 F-type H+-transporting ATPase subunit gamma [Sulfitobacter guttiformis]
MTERLADISARIDGIRQLGTVVNAMKGIAAARAHIARTQLAAVDSYAATITSAMSQVLGPNIGPMEEQGKKVERKTGLLVFCAEQGFAGAFSERVLESVYAQAGTASLFLVGTRGLSVAVARGLAPYWSAPLPSHTSGIPKLADEVTSTIYGAIAQGRIDALDVVFTERTSGRPDIVRQRLFPIDLANLPPTSADRPLMQLPDDILIAALSQDYFNAEVCKAALHAFAAENEARMEAMTSAGSQITRELKTFQAILRRVRQEAITAEIIELSTGAQVAR